MVELLVLIFILLILLSIFVPYGLHLREHSRRANCADNLRQIFGALQNYSHDNGSSFPRTPFDPATVGQGYRAFTGDASPDPFAADSKVEANDVTASYWLLYRIGYLVKSDYFVCDGDDASPDRSANPKQRSNFASASYLSYSFATPFSSNPEYRLTVDLPSDFVLAADLNPARDTDARPDRNSTNHRGAGQNVLYAYGAVKFQASPACAINADNIYTLDPRPTTTTAPSTQPSTEPADDLSPRDITDCYLVPAMRDRR
jgi:type II secretory pathway pseudopilin PulG